MKKLILLSLAFLFGSITLSAQDTLKTGVEVHQLIANVAQKGMTEGVDAMKQGIEKMKIVIDEKQNEIDAWANEIESFTDEIKIDSLENLVEVNETIIDALEDSVDELEDGIDELQDAIAEVSEEWKDVEITEGGSDCKKRKSKKFKGHWAGMQLGLNTLVTPNFSLNLPAESDFMTPQLNNSFEFDFNPLQFSIPFFNRYVGAVTGVGFSFNNYELIQNVNLSVDADGNLTHTLSDVAYDKNRFKTFNLNVPLIIEFQIPVNKKDKRIFLGAGVIGTMNLSGKMKTIYTDGNTTVKYKDKSSNWPLTQFSYQATARIGYDDWYIFANVPFMPLFESNKGPDLAAISAGIGFRF